MSLGIRELAIGYESVLLSDLHVDVHAGEVVALLGPSGCGRSTLLQTILGSVPAHAGSVLVDGVDVTTVPIEKRRIGIVFQQPLLFPHLSVGRNVSYGLERQGVSRADARARARALLAWVGLEDLADRDVQTLSGGQSQRVAVARAMAVEPRVLLLDEPFSALDEELRERLATETTRSLRGKDVAVVYVKHSRDEAQAVADRVLSFNELQGP